MTCRLAISLTLLAALAGCSSPGRPGPVEVAAGSYASAFDAAKESLREYNFTLDRIDAASGVITTRPKNTGGLLTPWDGEQSTVGQEWSDMINQQTRAVRIAFTPAGSPTPVSLTPASPTTPPASSAVPGPAASG